MHEDNCFITLTYNDDHLPENGSLDVTHFQKFMKRLREKSPNKIRFFHCGEYGDETFRPHYHGLLFGHDFKDRKPFSKKGENTLDTSQTLEDIWGKGFCTVGNVTFDSAAYVARYVMKKITGDAAIEHYKRLNPETGEIHTVKPEYTTMSRRPGIGRTWWDKYGQEVVDHGSVVVNGREVKPPSAYSRIMQDEAPKSFRKHKAKLLSIAKQNAPDNTPERLRVKEKVKIAQISNLKRTVQ